MINGATQVIINASAHNIPLPAGFIHTVCTSPPYYSLRKYAGEQMVDWPAMEYSPLPGLPPLTVESMRCALGLEPTPESFVGHLVLCFREVYRVMRDDGVAWLNLGDSYSSGGGPEPAQTKWQVEGASDGQADGRSRSVPNALKQGDLMMIPHRLALALQADGWTVRNDVVWHKVAPMPESVSGPRWERHRIKVSSKDLSLVNPQKSDNAHRQPQKGLAGHSGGAGLYIPATIWSDCPGCDKCAATGGYVLRRGSWRHTRAHEYVLMLTKGMSYWSDQERVKEDVTGGAHARGDGLHPKSHAAGEGVKQNVSFEAAVREIVSSRNPRDVLAHAGIVSWQEFHAWFMDTYGEELADDLLAHLWHDAANPGDLLAPSPEAYKGAHYAVYPRTLISPLLQATAPSRVCPVCGAPWVAVVERMNKVDPSAKGSRFDLGKTGRNGDGRTQEGERYLTQSTGYRPTCDHDVEPIPGWCLDPFAGTFTTGAVCAELGVNCVGLDISHEYLDDHAKPRIGLTPSGALETLPLFQDR
jgi:DNA modification methylase